MILALRQSTEFFVEKFRERYNCECSVDLNDDHCVGFGCQGLPPTVAV